MNSRLIWTNFRVAISMALSAAVAVTVVACDEQGPLTRRTRESGVVERIVDGDTLWIRLGNVTEKTRLVLIDTPETMDPEVGAECYGAEATAELDRLIPAGTDVDVERAEDERDQYGRLLAYVWRADDGLAINRELVRLGYARVLVISPNTQGAAGLEILEREARRNFRGLWGACRVVLNDLN
jgi:micrococcal nuclease